MRWKVWIKLWSCLDLNISIWQCDITHPGELGIFSILFRWIVSELNVEDNYYVWVRRGFLCLLTKKLVLDDKVSCSCDLGYETLTGGRAALLKSRCAGHSIWLHAMFVHTLNSSQHTHMSRSPRYYYPWRSHFSSGGWVIVLKLRCTRCSDITQFNLWWKPVWHFGLVVFFDIVLIRCVIIYLCVVTFSLPLTRVRSLLWLPVCKVQHRAKTNLLLINLP